MAEGECHRCGKDLTDGTHRKAIAIQKVAIIVEQDRVVIMHNTDAQYFICWECAWNTELDMKALSK